MEERMKKELFLISILLFLCCWIDLKPLDLMQSKNTMIRVHVSGAVEKEEDVTVPMYSTVKDVLENIQLLTDADTSTLNPSTILKDADILNIPFQKNAEEMQHISINTASLTELQQIPGIGPSLAQRIVEYREQEGLFQAITDLMHVKGIGEAKFEKMKDFVTL